ncbi:MAG TPA: adenylate/guanylate cyclase domain-containing protein [Mycobacteriales bacterium]|nr:adenylate/guanylate cyclase domain-containing protein [Mycobacteriales bacterium]
MTAPAGAAQRRVVTLLFADLAGYTALCETRDPEQVHLLVRPLMDTLRALCEERGGIVPGIQGDGFMAVFGAHAAQEDDPAHALDAAVQLQRAVEARRLVLPELPPLRVGLHVGDVLVASAWDAAELSVSGDAVNVASRVCSHAAPGEVLASREAVALSRTTGGWLGERELVLRGREAPVTVEPFDWEGVPEVVRGPRWSAASPYVARPELEDALREALRTEPSQVLVVGDAGMGKTRLVRQVLEDRQVVAAAAAAAFRPTACGVCADLLEQLPEVPADLLRLLRGGASQGQADETFLLRAAGAHLSRVAPEATVFVDDGEALPEEESKLLLEAVRAAGLPWVLASRTSLPALRFREVHVPAWSEAEAAELLEANLPRASSELRAAVLERAGDSPLYVEQCARLLLDSGAVVVDRQGAQVVEPGRLRDIPRSMRLFVSSRLDLLPEPERAVLGCAAVLGPEPDLALLRHLVGEQESARVEALVERGFLKWTPGPAGQPQLRFSHALVRDVANETQLRSRRVEIHRAAAEWYAVLPVVQVLESQAYHLEAAVRLQEPDCDLLRRTVEAMVLYARSIEDERTRTSRDVLERARELADSRPECPVDRLPLELATASVQMTGLNEPEARAAAERALVLAGQRKDSRALAEAHLHLGRTHALEGPELALRHLAEAEAAYTGVQDLGGLGRVEVERAFLAQLNEGTPQYLESLERAYGLAMRSGDTRLQAASAQQLAMHHAFSSGRAGYELWAGTARDVTRRDDVGVEPRLELARACLAMFELRPSLGREAAVTALSASRDLGLLHTYVNSLVVAADLHLLSGELDAAEVVLAEGREVAAMRPTEWLGLQFDLIEARVRVRRGDPAGAQELLERVAEHDLVDRRVLRRDLAEARAWVSLERGRFGEARALAVEAVAVDEELREQCAPLRPRLVELVATVAAGDAPSLATIAALRAQARESGLPTVAQLASRWLYVEELTRGWSVDLHGLEELDVVECRALDLEIGAFSSGLWEMLLDAAAIWAQLGSTVWHARALLWHSELTGTPSPEADSLLRALQAPEGLGEQLRAQVRALRS